MEVNGKSRGGHHEVNGKLTGRSTESQREVNKVNMKINKVGMEDNEVMMKSA
jgi:hypothetical protein